MTSWSALAEMTLSRQLFSIPTLMGVPNGHTCPSPSIGLLRRGARAIGDESERPRCDPQRINTLSASNCTPTREPTQITRNMKLLNVTLFFILPIISLAQNVVIGYPPAGQSIVPGADFTVQIERPV